MKTVLPIAAGAALSFALATVLAFAIFRGKAEA